MTFDQHNINRGLLATCVAAAARAADVIRRGAATRGTLEWETKSQTDFVSDVDRDAERAINEVILSRHADAHVLGVEFSPTVSAREGLVFVADPLDGTTNFLHGIPCYAVSIAAMVDDELRAGVVLNVANGELFTATAGGGARLGGQPIVVSTIEDPLRSLIATGFPFKGGQKVDEYMRILPRIMLETSGVRRPGAAALDLAEVACGRFEGFFELELSPWDIAAGLLLIREAGGVVTDLSGAPCNVEHTGLVAGNPIMQKWLLDRVRG
ncbi:MAG: inositol monophosphatase family protein [Gemmatimonadaceae bacterium]